MKRTEQLLHLSRDHHQALVYAKHAAAGRLPQSSAEGMADFWQGHLAPHFAMEESLLPPVLGAAAPDLLQRMRTEHTELRNLAHAVMHGDMTQLPAFAGLLAAHVRFEERELFPAYEQLQQSR